MTYVAGFLTPVPNGNKQAYIESARKAWPLFKEYGALQIMETWGDQVPAGEHTDFRRAVALEDGEMIRRDPSEICVTLPDVDIRDDDVDVA